MFSDKRQPKNILEPKSWQKSVCFNYLAGNFILLNFNVITWKKSYNEYPLKVPLVPQKFVMCGLWIVFFPVSHRYCKT